MSNNPYDLFAMPTLAEHEATTERVAVARSIVRNGHWPSPGELQQELSCMGGERARGLKVIPIPSTAEALLFLEHRKLAVPPMKKK